MTLIPCCMSWLCTTVRQTLTDELSYCLMYVVALGEEIVHEIHRNLRIVLCWLGSGCGLEENLNLWLRGHTSPS